MNLFTVTVNKEINEKKCKKELDTFLNNNETKLIDYVMAAPNPGYAAQDLRNTKGYHSKITIDELAILFKSKLLFKINTTREDVIQRGNVALIEAFFDTSNLTDDDRFDYNQFLRISLEVPDKNIFPYLVRKTKHIFDAVELFDIILPDIDDVAYLQPINEKALDDKYLDQFITLLEIVDRKRIILKHEEIILRFGMYNSTKMLKYFLEYLKGNLLDYTKCIVIYILQNKLEFADTVLKYGEQFNELDITMHQCLVVQEPNIESLSLLHNLYSNDSIKLSDKFLASLLMICKKSYPIGFAYFKEAFPHVIYYIALNHPDYDNPELFIEIYDYHKELFEKMKYL